MRCGWSRKARDTAALRHSLGAMRGYARSIGRILRLPPIEDRLLRSVIVLASGFAHRPRCVFQEVAARTPPQPAAEDGRATEAVRGCARSIFTGGLLLAGFWELGYGESACMALITCPECGKSVSDKATACPGCGFPLASGAAVVSPRPAAPPAIVDVGTELLVVRPSWWNYFWHLFFFWLIIPPLIAWYRRSTFVMRIYPDRVSIDQGFWSKDSREFFIKDVRAVDVRQGVWGRMVGIGDVTISTAANVDAAELASGVPDPQGIKELLIAQRRQSPT